MDIQIENDPKTHKIELELRSDIVPKTADNFLQLCKGYTQGDKVL